MQPLSDLSERTEDKTLAFQILSFIYSFPKNTFFLTIRIFANMELLERCMFCSVLDHDANDYLILINFAWTSVYKVFNAN